MLYKRCCDSLTLIFDRPVMEQYNSGTIAFKIIIEPVTRKPKNLKCDTNKKKKMVREINNSSFDIPQNGTNKKLKMEQTMTKLSL